MNNELDYYDHDDDDDDDCNHIDGPMKFTRNSSVHFSMKWTLTNGMQLVDDDDDGCILYFERYDNLHWTVSHNGNKYYGPMGNTIYWYYSNNKIVEIKWWWDEMRCYRTYRKFSLPFHLPYHLFITSSSNRFTYLSSNFIIVFIFSFLKQWFHRIKSSDSFYSVEKLKWIVTMK